MATLPTYTAPAYKELGTYSAPTWDESAVDTLTQKRAASGLRAMRSQINRVSGVNYGNQNVKRMTLRDALAGYGSGLSSVMSGASEAAAGEYGTQYSLRSANARAAYESEVNAANAYNKFAEDTAKTRYAGEMAGYGTETGKETAAEAAATAAAAAKTRYGYETESTMKAAQTAAGVATTAYGREQTALEKAYDLWKQKYLWTEEQEDIAETEAKEKAMVGTQVRGPSGYTAPTYRGGFTPTRVSGR